MKVSKIKGTIDYFGREIKKYRYIEEVARNISKQFGYLEIQTPVFEATEVFARGVGEGTDIVNKEMYTFFDRSNKSLTLRPEGTAGVSRAYVENKMYVEPGLRKLFYFEQMFRCERPQAGRYRAFTQFGIEAIGPGSAYLDADVIYFAYLFLQKLGIKNVKVAINTIGSIAGRARYEEALKEYFSKHIENMCDDCKTRLEKNPLRILDCKVDAKSEIMANAPKIMDYLSDEDKDYFNKVLSSLDALDVNYVIEPKLVRGLDYYNNTVFEFIYDDESSNINGLTLLGGGRYNGLSKAFDGPEMDAIGFGTGVERLMLVLDELNLFEDDQKLVDVVVINIGEETKVSALHLAAYLRSNNVSCELDYVSSNLKPQFKLSERMNAPYIIIIGSEEVENGVFKLKNTIEKTEQLLKIEQLNDIFAIGGEKYAYKK
ncbi:MAG: histidine--tRNA ligase [Bacilli bacterium]|nr:histidine--tRNA ligase [Bacilli bacterium]